MEEGEKQLTKPLQQATWQRTALPEATQQSVAEDICCEVELSTGPAQYLSCDLWLC
jgi:hypothetical protein